MKTTNLQEDGNNAGAIAHGFKAPKRATAGMPLVTDSLGNEVLANVIHLAEGSGLFVADDDENTAIISGVGLDPDGDATGSGSVFNVRDYGAVGDGVAVDCAAINAAIAALNTATRGVLYFPAGTYLCDSGLTTITASGLVLGDGAGVTDPATRINQSSATADLFTVSGDGLSFRGLYMANSSAGATTSDGIVVTGGAWSQYDDLTIGLFRDAVVFTGDVKYWRFQNSYIEAIRYGFNIENTTNPDSGDWCLGPGNVIGFSANNGTGVYLANSGGGRIIGNKFNAGARTSCIGIHLDADGTDASGGLIIEANSLENFDTHGIFVEQADTATWSSLLIVGNQFGMWTSTAGDAIAIVAEDAGGVSRVIISSNSFHATTANTGAAVELTNVAGVRLAANIVTGFDTYYTATTCTNLTDDETGHQIDYAQITSNVSITGTTEGTATAIVSTNARTYDGLTTILIEFYAYVVEANNGAVNRTLRIGLFDGSTGIGIIHLSATQVAGVSNFQTVYAARKITPTAGAHTYNAKGWVSASPGGVGAGAGGANTPMPCFIRITKAA